MNKFEKINKLNELREQLEVETKKEVKNQELINKLIGSIRSLGLTLTAWDFTK